MFERSEPEIKKNIVSSSPLSAITAFQLLLIHTTTNFRAIRHGKRL